MKTFLFFLATVVITGARAQQLPKSQVFLQNAEAGTVSFGLSCDDRQSWKSVTLKGHDGRRFECDSSSAKMWGHINTDLTGESHQEAELPLQNGNRYEVFFDQAGRRWNLRLMGAAGIKGVSTVATTTRENDEG